MTNSAFSSFLNAIRISSPRGSHWIVVLLAHIDILKFAADWLRLAGRGSRNLKTMFYLHCFAEQHPDIGDDYQAAIKTTHKDDYKTWPVLIDPVWNVSVNRSRPFVHVLEELSVRFKDGDIQCNHKHSTEVLLNLARIFGSVGVAAHVRQFLDAYPPEEF
ncbi:hypothetical protein BXZ70DRAFT_1010984 [Cristinia sonorae]|uniref:Uncharacterized protein n=1 Tax=Cristinia sonorae TaxID=1940300 RepID=A0A8K0XLU2_9AGAR|nr:hypothetical protein BXZ70DRAFT_1010984 [Cristinia sonorae]